ncbi:RTA-like protein [Penicillium robsamsonii]|uniref:RTA-like protein n=1 Tax=Penicillium robsamsonii TaxID=1792511 RepID=UPI002547DA34|nr:RTA-like protein [Penicillium robsamsonii]KAJ5835387.1 RTA-like protein [Penicillium robsamsonii]
MSSLGEAKDLDSSIEDQLNARRGYTAAVNNPKVSKKSKRNALDLLNDELDGDTPRHYLDEAPPGNPSGLSDLERTKCKSHHTTQSESDSSRLDQYPG